MPTSAKRQSACTRTCLCASSTEARLGPIRVSGRSSGRSDVVLCIPNARPRSSHTGDAAALQTSPKYSSGGGGGPRFFKCHFLFFGRPEHTCSCLGTEREVQGSWLHRGNGTECAFFWLWLYSYIPESFFYAQKTWSQLENFVHFIELCHFPDGRPLPRPKVTIYNPQQGCPVAQQKGGFGGAGAGVDASLRRHSHPKRRNCKGRLGIAAAHTRPQAS